MNKMMHVYCPFCGQKYITEEVPNGTQAECVKCGQSFIVNEANMTSIVMVSKWKMLNKPILKKAILAVTAVVILLVGVFFIGHSSQSKDEKISKMVVKAIEAGVNEWIVNAKKGNYSKFIIVKLPKSITKDEEKLKKAMLYTRLAVEITRSHEFIKLGIISDFVFTDSSGAFVLDSVSIN